MQNLHPELVAGAYIINQEGKMLLVKSPKWGRQWMVPGGHIEYGEEILAAAKREAKEELGLNVKPLGVLSVAQDIFPKDFHTKKHFVYFEIVCTTKSKKVKIDGREVSDYKWFTIRDAIHSVTHPLLKKVIKKYFDQRKSGKLRLLDISAY